MIQTLEKKDQKLITNINFDLDNYYRTLPILDRELAKAKTIESTIIDSLSVNRNREKSISKAYRTDVLFPLLKNGKDSKAVALRSKLSNLGISFETLEKFLANKKKLGFSLSSKTLYTIGKTQTFANSVKFISEYKLLEHILGTKTYALPIFKHTPYVVLDIDGRNNKDSLETVKEVCSNDYFGKPFFIEYSPKSNGYHIYFEYSKYYSGQQARVMETLFNDSNEGMQIEVKVKGDQLRLPFSNDYSIKGSLDLSNSKGIAELDLDSCLDLFLNHNKHSITPFLENILDPKIEVSLNKRFLDDLTIGSKDFTYGRGTRFITHRRIAYSLLNDNIESTLDDYIQACEYWNDGTSKDMSLPECKRNKILNIAWKSAVHYFKPMSIEKKDQTSMLLGSLLKNTDKVYSELIYDEDSYLSNEDYDNLKSILNYNYTRCKLGKAGGVYQKKLVQEATQVMEFLTFSNEWRQEQSYSYADSQFKDLEKGFPFGVKLQNTVKDHFNLKTNIRKIMELLQLSGLIKPITLENGYRYSYVGVRFVAHYLISSIKDTYNNMKELYTNIFYRLISSIKSSYNKRRLDINNINNYIDFIHKGIIGSKDCLDNVLTFLIVKTVHKTSLEVKSLLGGKSLSDRLLSIREKWKKNRLYLETLRKS